MKRGCMREWMKWVPVILIVGGLVSAHTAWAAESAVAGWRPVYDLVMRWINFIILAFVLFKFGRTPLKNFLKHRQADIADQIEALEQEKADVLAEVERNLEAIDASQERFEQMKARIMRQGERRKQELIEAGKTESAILIDAAKRKIENQILSAHANLRSELIDAAFEIALERLPKLVEPADNDRRIEAFYSQVAAD